MPIQSIPALCLRLRFCVRNSPLHFVIAAVVLSVLPSATYARAQEIPAESYGPYNAVFLPDGPGLTKPLAAPSPLDSRTAALLDRLGLNKEPDQRDVLLEGRATWTLAFWFRSSEALQGSLLLAGIGDPAAEDARYVGVLDGRLALWLGRGVGSGKLLAGEGALSNAPWHFAALVGDGENVTLYADGKPVLTHTLAQGDVAGNLELAPALLERIADRHFGGQISGLRVYREALTAAQIQAVDATPPDFALPTYEEASRHWPVQTFAQAGYSAPQDPSTYPRGKGAIQKPTA